MYIFTGPGLASCRRRPLSSNVRHRMLTFPYGLALGLSSLFAGVSLAVVAGWITSFLFLRKDERAVQLDQVTKERTKWRENMRKATEDMALIYFENKASPTPGKVAALRARFATSVNLKDDEDDKQILIHFDELFTGSRSDLDLFSRRIALLLKHDWERVKWECTPIYLKLFTRLSKKQRQWRQSTYRKVDA